VIVRTHGRMGIERAVLGSVTQEVLAGSRVPIMLLRPGGRRISHINKLLVPVDPAWDEEALTSAHTYVEGGVKRLRAAQVAVHGEARQAPWWPKPLCRLLTRATPT
jgi:hypothetical protein